METNRAGLLAVCAFVACSASASVPLSAAGDGHLTVPAYVNDQGPFPFVLDTGADVSGIYEWFAEQAHIAKGKSQSLTGMTGTTTAPTYKLSSLAIDRRRINAFVADGYPNRRDTGRQAGVAGNDLMDGSVVVFDFPCRSVDLYPKPVVKSVVPTTAVELHGGSVQDGTQLTFPISVNGVQGVAVLDTGSRDTKINPRFAAAAGIDVSSLAFRDGDAIYGANLHAVSSRIGPVNRLEFAGYKLSGVDIRVIDLPVFESFGIGGGPAMILGIDIMQRYRLVYDHQQKRFWFGESKCRPQTES